MRVFFLAVLVISMAPALRAEPSISGGAVAVPRSVVARGGGLSSGGGLILN